MLGEGHGERRMPVWRFQTRLGTLCIRPSRMSDGSWELCLADDVIGTYPSPEAAAQDVAKKATGDRQLDQSLGWWAPASLEEWERTEQA